MSLATLAPNDQADQLNSPAAVGILFNLPEHLQTIEVLRALICADEAGYQRRAREPFADALAQIRLSSSRPA